MSQLQDQLEGLPGYGLIMDTFNDYAEQHFNKLDPFEDEDGNKRKLSPKASKEDQKLIRNDWPIKDWDPTIMEAIRLKYWVNIQNGIKEWEQGKPVHLTH